MVSCFFYRHAAASQLNIAHHVEIREVDKVEVSYVMKLSEAIKPDIHQSLALLKILAPSSQHLRQGKVKPMTQVFRDLRERQEKFVKTPPTEAIEA